MSGSEGETQSKMKAPTGLGSKTEAADYHFNRTARFHQDENV